MAELTNANLIYLFPAPLPASTSGPTSGGAQRGSCAGTSCAREQAHPGMAKTNIGGWHSETGRLEWCGKAGETLLSRMSEAANYATYRMMADLGRPMPEFKWTLQAWANVSRAGSFNKPHTHGGATWSGTYYVDTGDSSARGRRRAIAASCSWIPTRAAPTRSFRVWCALLTAFVQARWSSGLMVLFPSYLPHMVYVHQGKRPRISIAFNLRKEPFPSDMPSHTSLGRGACDPCVAAVL